MCWTYQPDTSIYLNNKMILSYIIILFFAILAIVYPLVLIMASMAGWYAKRRLELKKGKDSKEYIHGVERIDQRTDSFKEVFFNVAVFVILFAVAPFAVFYYFL